MSGYGQPATLDFKVRLDKALAENGELRAELDEATKTIAKLEKENKELKITNQLAESKKTSASRKSATKEEKSD